jgi:hypothetical protein
MSAVDPVWPFHASNLFLRVQARQVEVIEAIYDSTVYEAEM